VLFTIKNQGCIASHHTSRAHIVYQVYTTLLDRAASQKYLFWKTLHRDMTIKPRAEYHLTQFDWEPEIETDALHALPQDAQEFIKRFLNQQVVTFKSWGWFEIVWMFKDDNRQWVKLCSTGSPARDIGFVWVYNVDTKRYEQYDTQYHPPISLRKNQAPENTAESLDELFASLDFPKY